MSSRRWKLVSALAALALPAAAPASAYWFRWSVFNADLAPGAYYGGGVGDLAIYESRYGFGIGTQIADAKIGGWDIRRKGGLPDVSGHALSDVFPIKGYLALHSWQGDAFFHDDSNADRTVGHLDAYFSYSNWSTLWGLNEATTNILGERTRSGISDTLRAKVVDYGLRLDPGTVFLDQCSVALAIGRMEFRTREDAVYRSRYESAWYAKLSFFWGATLGTKQGGGTLWLFRDAWYVVSRPFRRRGVVSED